MRYPKKSITLFVISLILLFPVYTVAAVTNLELVRHSGSDGIDGAITTNDKVVIHVNASIDGDNSITPSQLKVNNIPFSSCTPGNYSLCIYESPVYSIAIDTYDFKIDLYKDDGTSIRTINTQIAVDNNAPDITINSVGQSGSNVSISLTIKDSAWQEGDYSVCSGIQKVEFFDSATKIGEDVVNSSSCTYSKTLLIGQPVETGVVTVKAYDNFNHVASKTSSSFDFDASTPSIESDSFIIEKQGIILSDYIQKGNYTVNVYSAIEDENLDTSSVKLELSTLGGGSDLAGSCSLVSENLYNCSWIDQPISISGTVSANIVISAKDKFGNDISQTISKTYTVDETGPSIISIKTAHVYNETSYIGELGTDIIVEFSESSGIEAGSVHLDMSNLGDYGSENPDNCTGSGNTWRCIWKDVMTTASNNEIATVYVQNTYDLAGNPAEGTVELDIHVDKQSPIISNYELISISSLEKPSEYISSGDDLDITLNITEKNGVVVYGNFSSIGSGEAAGTCIQDNEKYNCIINIDSVNEGYISETIALYAEDSAGNIAVIDVPIIIYSRSESAADLWSVSSISYSPSKIDRQAAPLINQRVYAHVKLSGDGEILNMALSECIGDTGYLNAAPYLFNEGTDPYIKFELKKTKANVDSLNLNCTLDIVTLSSNTIYPLEKQSVPISITFYNMPLGELSDSLKNKIENEYETWIEDWGIVGQLQQIFDLADMICNTYYTVRQLLNTLQAITTGLGVIGNGLKATVVGSSAGEGVEQVRKVMCGTTEGAKKAADTPSTGLAAFADKFCGFINCTLGPSEDGKDKGGLEGWGTMLGGGGGLNINNWVGADTIKKFTQKTPTGKWEGSDEYSRYSGSEGYMNVKDSFVLSLLTFCIPGLIYNLDKLRQTQCYYIDCLQTGLDTGVSIAYCDKAKEYMTCKLIFGELFNLVPFTALYDYYIDIIKDAFSNPLSFVGFGVGLLCGDLCDVEDGDITHSLCIWPKLFAEIGDAIANVNGIIDSDAWALDNDYCSIVEDRGKDYAGSKTTTDNTNTTSTDTVNTGSDSGTSNTNSGTDNSVQDTTNSDSDDLGETEDNPEDKD